MEGVMGAEGWSAERRTRMKECRWNEKRQKEWWCECGGEIDEVRNRVGVMERAGRGGVIGSDDVSRGRTGGGERRRNERPEWEWREKKMEQKRFSFVILQCFFMSMCLILWCWSKALWSWRPCDVQMKPTMLLSNQSSSLRSRVQHSPMI